MGLRDLLRTISEVREVTDQADAIVIREATVSVVYFVADKRGRRKRREVVASPEERSAFLQGTNMATRAAALIDATYPRAHE